MALDSKIIIKEELTKADVDAQIKTQLNSNTLKVIVDKIIMDTIKGDKALEDKMIEISKNAMTQLFKALYTKRNIWKSNITNKSS